MRSYTDLEQSKKLAEILPIESADMTWEKVAKSLTEDFYWKPTIGLDSAIKDNLFSYRNGYVLPCWSLTALLARLDETVTTDDGDFNLHIFVENGGYYVQYDDNYEGKILVESGFQEYLMDAVYDVVLKLSELKLL